MSPESADLLQCYNKGCGQKYTESANNDESCWHHPGVPVFHDAYKKWSCCNKKSTDFTEFLNFKGCTRSKHCNIKPAEPEKPQRTTLDPHEVISVRPIVPISKDRPPYDIPLTLKTPEIAAALQQQDLGAIVAPKTEEKSGQVALGTICKNGGCGATYEGPPTDETECVHHPGVPIFHEGLKFWSCCQKRTTDFNAFLGQVGCEHGRHVWTKEDENSKNAQCRWDYHQTGTHVVVAIYAKQYCVKSSTVRLNPIRLDANLVFPQQSNATFRLDVELRGVIDVEASEVAMYGSKVEIKLRKAEPGSWPRLDIPRPASMAAKVALADAAALIPQVDAVDLDDL